MTILKNLIISIATLSSVVLGIDTYQINAKAVETDSVSYLSQTDDRWADLDITGYGSIEETGCLPTVATMIIDTLKHDDYTPVEIGTVLHQNGYYGVVRDYLLSAGTFSDCWEFIGKTYDLKVDSIYTKEEMKNFLARGGLIAACVQDVFVDGGYTHEILISKYSDKKDSVYVYDPYDSENNGWYSIDLILSIGSPEWYNTYDGSSYIGLYI